MNVLSTTALITSNVRRKKAAKSDFFHSRLKCPKTSTSIAKTSTSIQFNSIQSSIQRHPADGYKNVYPEIKSLSGAASTLQMIRFQLDKIYHPDHLHHNPDYDFNMSKSLGDNCKDVSRAFYDFINNADAKCDRSGN